MNDPRFTRRRASCSSAITSSATPRRRGGSARAGRQRALVTRDHAEDFGGTGGHARRGHGQVGADGRCGGCRRVRDPTPCPSPEASPRRCAVRTRRRARAGQRRARPAVLLDGRAASAALRGDRPRPPPAPGRHRADAADACLARGAADRGASRLRPRRRPPRRAARRWQSAAAGHRGRPPRHRRARSRRRRSNRRCCSSGACRATRASTCSCTPCRGSGAVAETRLVVARAGALRTPVSATRRIEVRNDHIQRPTSRTSSAVRAS